MLLEDYQMQIFPEEFEMIELKLSLKLLQSMEEPWNYWTIQWHWHWLSLKDLSLSLLADYLTN